MLSELGNLAEDLGKLGLDKGAAGNSGGQLDLELPDLGTGPPNETRPGVRNLRSWLNRNIKVRFFSRIHSKVMKIPWVTTGSHPYQKIMSCIVLYPVFYLFYVNNQEYLLVTNQMWWNKQILLHQRSWVIWHWMTCNYPSNNNHRLNHKIIFY